MSAPSSPGGVSSVRASRSAATVTSPPRSLACRDHRGEVAHAAGGTRLLQDDAEESPRQLGQVRREVGDDHLDAERPRRGRLTTAMRLRAGSRRRATTAVARP